MSDALPDKDDILRGEFWRCPTCGRGIAMGHPATFTAPPQCPTHGEMEQTTIDGWRADWAPHE